MPRPRLVERLNEGPLGQSASLSEGRFARKLTLISAPAGFGKTTLLSEWVGSCGQPVAWVSLDEGDNDPSRFLAYFIAALRTVREELGETGFAMLQSPQSPPVESVLTTLINEIAVASDQGQFALVLDDYHTIKSQSIHSALTFLLDHLPPQMHLVIATRADPPLPLPRLRVQGELTELRITDLRFNDDEVAAFFNKVMDLGLSTEDIAALASRTEGWAAGLQVAALSLQGREDVTSFIQAFTGSNRYILDYLDEEVLQQQTEPVQTFLLQTAILDRLTGPLCDAVCFRGAGVTTKGSGQATLEALERANLFVIPLDDERRWYRYHHLFADLLRGLENTLQGDETAELHRRASHWYVQAGDERGAFVSEAIQHALAAADYAMAVDLLEKHATGMIMQGYAKTVDGWVQMIPQEWRSSSSKTDLAFAWMHALRGTYAQAFLYIEQLQAAFQAGEEGDPAIKAEWLVLQSLMLNMQGNPAESMTLVSQALEIAPQEDSRVRSLVYWGLAGVYHLMEDYARAVEAYQMAIQHGQMAGNFVAEMMSVAGLASMALEHGQLHLAFEIASQAVAQIERSGMLPPISAVAYGALGQVYCEWHQLEQARGHILRAIELSALGGYNTGAIYYRILLSRLLQVEGNLEAAAQGVQQAADLAQVEAPPDVREEVVAQQVRVYLAQDRLAAAEMALRGRGFSFEDKFTFPDLPPTKNMALCQARFL